MPVSSVDSGVIVYGDGSTVEFFFTFGEDSAADINAAFITDVGLTAIPGADFTVALNPGAPGGSVTFNTAPANAQGIYIYRATPQTQLVGITSQNKYDPKVVQGVWDKLTFITQEVSAKVDRALLVPPGVDPGTLLTGLDTAVQNAGIAASLSQAWAESPAAPGSPGTKSSKTWAGEAQAAANSILGLTASASILGAGLPATATYDPLTGNMAFGIPKGDQGDKGDPGVKGDPGDLSGPGSAVADRIAVFNGVSGSLLKDGGKTIAELFSSTGLTGTPTAPTATKGTNTTQLATTAFVATATLLVSEGAKGLAPATGTPSGNFLRDDKTWAGVLGVGQTWQNMSASRAANTSYQNTTGKPIMVSIVSANDATMQVSTDNTTWVTVGASQNTVLIGAQIIIPDTHYYKLVAAGFVHWAELR